MHFEEITQIKAFSFGDSEKVSERKRQEGGDFEGNFKFRSGSAKRGKRGTTNALRTKGNFDHSAGRRKDLSQWV